MEPIFDRHSRLAGWLRDETIFDTSMRFGAFIRGRGVFAPQAGHIGFFWDGVFRDRAAGAVAFLRGYSPGPIRRLRQRPPPLRCRTDEALRC